LVLGDPVWFLVYQLLDGEAGEWTRFPYPQEILFFVLCQPEPAEPRIKAIAWMVLAGVTLSAVSGNHV
jgi:hypothetical protein